MKIAIKGHALRGKEVIQILESLGGKNVVPLNGTDACYYYIDDNLGIYCHDYEYVNKYCKKYTLEEFEKEFPFKVGDIVSLKGINDSYEVIALVWYMNKLCYKLDNGLHYNSNTLTTYEKMKEKRNITLTLEKAKEWYKKGGELKEVALQAYSEEELTKVGLPKTWEEFCEDYPVQKGECWLGARDEIIECTFSHSGIDRKYKNWIPSKKSAEAHFAMMQLEQLRDCYNNSSNDTNRIAIINNNGNIELYVNPPFNCFLTFKNYLLAKEFFSNFKEIIEIAKELI